jgi:predicted regulator of Ras-like GTPase activity (Roadblock/LC7/MglB family)
MDIVLMQEDLERIQDCLQRVLEKSGAHTILLIDRSGQLISSSGNQAPEDSVALAALVAANFGATAAIAKMLGERDFSLLFHKGKDENIHFASMGEDLLLVTVFDNQVSLGLVRLHSEQAIDELAKIFATVFHRK